MSKLNGWATQSKTSTSSLIMRSLLSTVLRVTGASFSSGSLSFSRAPALILSGVHVGSHTTSTSTASTAGSLPTSSLIISRRRAANGHQPS